MYKYTEHYEKLLKVQTTTGKIFWISMSHISVVSDDDNLIMMDCEDGLFRVTEESMKWVKKELGILKVGEEAKG